MIVSLCERGVQCWACSITVERFSRYGDHGSIWEWYERAVEAIEATRGPFTISEVWHANGGGPSLSNALTKAVRDMRMHGLLRCIKRTPSRNRCLQWIVVR